MTVLLLRDVDNEIVGAVVKDMITAIIPAIDDEATIYIYMRDGQRISIYGGYDDDFNTIFAMLISEMGWS
jgi:hypothetical protein